MLYKVKAKLIGKKIDIFYKKLLDGTIYNQHPDGKEIITSMKGAKLTNFQFVEWFENCGCSPPLKHERETQYDYYFSNMKVELADKIVKINGKSFWSYMENNYKNKNT